MIFVIYIYISKNIYTYVYDFIDTDINILSIFDCLLFYLIFLCSAAAFAVLTLCLIDVSLLVWFSSLAILVWMYPFIRLLLHIIFYHVLPEKAYRNKNWGNRLFYASEIISHLSGILSLFATFLSWRFIFPLVTFPDIGTRHLLISVEPIIAVLTLWIGALGVKRLAMLRLINSFNQSTFLERVREVLFFDFVLEAMQETKRGRKVAQKEESNNSQAMRRPTTADSRIFPRTEFLGKELLIRWKNLTLPQSYLRNPQDPSPTVMPMDITAHAWKRLQDHLHVIALQDEQFREEMEEEADMNNDQLLLQHVAISKSRQKKLLEKKKQKMRHLETGLLQGAMYHHLHRFHHGHKKKKTSQRRSWTFNHSDERAQKLSGKLFKTLKRPVNEYIDIKDDLLPIFGFCASFPASRPNVDLSDTDLSRHLNDTHKRDFIGHALIYFFTQISENGQMTERDLRELLLREFRERKRLVASLSGKIV